MDETSPVPSPFRRVILGTGLSLAALPMALEAATRAPVRAVAFDAFTLFDPRSITRAVVALVPDKGAQLAAAWQARLFASTWLWASS